MESERLLKKTFPIKRAFESNLFPCGVRTGDGFCIAKEPDVIFSTFKKLATVHKVEENAGQGGVTFEFRLSKPTDEADQKRKTLKECF